MGSMVFVSVQPVGRHVTHFLHAAEGIAIEHLGAVGLVESFDIGILRRLAGPDVIEGDALGLRPQGQRVGDELGAVVQANRQRRTAHLHQLVQGPVTRAAGRLVSTSIEGPRGRFTGRTSRHLRHDPLAYEYELSQLADSWPLFISPINASLRHCEVRSSPMNSIKTSKKHDESIATLCPHWLHTFLRPSGADRTASRRDVVQRLPNLD